MKSAKQTSRIPQPSLANKISRMRRVLQPLAMVTVAAFCIGSNGGDANAQPGATPPGSVSRPYGPAPSGPPPPPPSSYNPQAATYPPPVPERVEQAPRGRDGLVLGLSLGFGKMTSDAGEFQCFECSQTPTAAAFGVHVGMMINPRLSIQGEIWGQSRSLDYAGDTSINQTLLLVGLQFWLTEKLWIKGGIGASLLSTTYYGETELANEGGAAMAAIGYELIRSDTFGWDIQFKTGAGFYQDGFDGNEETIETSTITMGLNWY